MAKIKRTRKAKQEKSESVVTFTSEQWQKILEKEDSGEVPYARAEILDIVNDYGYEKLAEYCQKNFGFVPKSTGKVAVE